MSLIRFRHTTSIAVIALALTGSANAFGQATPGRRTSRVPPGFHVLDDSFWKGPWVFSALNRSRIALPRLHNSFSEGELGPVPFRLDDGSTGTLRVESEGCNSPSDCASEGFTIAVDDANGRSVARFPFWAAYRDFDVVPVDLVGGIGDELLLIRRPAHAAPPFGPVLRIWKLGATAPVDLVESFSVAGYLATIGGAIPCARWQIRLLVDPLADKPRPISMAGEFAADVSSSDPMWTCRLNRQGADGAAALRRGESLSFSDGQYRLRDTSGTRADLLRGGD